MVLNTCTTEGRRNKGSVTVSNNNGSIKLTWRVNGVRFTLSPGYRYDELGLKAVQKVVTQIELDIFSRNFDESLEKYRVLAGLKPPEKPKKEEKPLYTHIYPVWAEWINTLEYKSHHYTAIGNWLKKENPKLSELASTLLECKSDLAACTYNQRLSYLRRCVQWAIDEGKITENPLKGVKNKRESQQVPEERKPFNSDEVAAIIEAFRSDRFCPEKSAFKHSYYADFVEVFFMLGTRPSEIIGLQVKHCDFKRGEIEISSSLVRQAYGGKSRVRKETKTGSVRYLPMSDRLREILLPRCQGRKLDDLVFTSPKGGWIDDGNFLDRQWKTVLKGLKIPYRVPYAVRHSMISRGLEQGIAPTGLAYLAGHRDSRMVIQRYGHMINRPDLPKL